MLKWAIFDLDGTLIDSMPFWENIGSEYLRSLGIEPAENINKLFRTFSVRQAAEYYQNTCKVDLPQNEIIGGINKMLEKAYKETIMPKKGVVDFLEKLAAKGVKMCVATANTRCLAESVLKRLDMDRFFEAIVTADSGKGEAYRAALLKIGGEKENTFVFEDALYAAEEAKNNGFVTVGIYDESEKNQKKLKQISDFYIFDYSDESFWKSV